MLNDCLKYKSLYYQRRSQEIPSGGCAWQRET